MERRGAWRFALVLAFLAAPVAIATPPGGFVPVPSPPIPPAVPPERPRVDGPPGARGPGTGAGDPARPDESRGSRPRNPEQDPDAPLPDPRDPRDRAPSTDGDFPLPPLPDGPGQDLAMALRRLAGPEAKFLSRHAPNAPKGGERR